MLWCHTCRLTYAPPAVVCRECGGALTGTPAPERRMAAAEPGGGLRIVATLSPEQALLASGRLDEHGIPASLRPSSGFGGGAPVTGDTPAAFDVLVASGQIGDARSLLTGTPPDPAHTHTLIMIAVVTGAALMLSAALFVARWLLSGSLLPR